MPEDWKHSSVPWFFNDSKESVLEIAKNCLIKAPGKILHGTILHEKNKRRNIEGGLKSSLL